MDPTAYIAMQHVENDKKKWRPFVYVCHSDTGDVRQNIRLEKEYCRFAIKQDAIPVSTVLCMTELLQVSGSTDVYSYADKLLLRKAEEVWVFGDIDQEQRKKIGKAERMRKKVRFFTEDMEEEFDV